MRVPLIGLAALCMGVTACSSQIPVAQIYPPVVQEKVQAAQHWDTAATHAARHLRETLVPYGDSPQRFVVRVVPAQSATVFGRAFQELLVTRLMDQGFTLTQGEGAGLDIVYQVQLISHKNRDTREASGDYYAGANPDVSDTPDNEILVTVSAVNGERFLSRVSTAYYVSDVNRAQYLSASPTRRMGVVDR